jgi:esterase
MTEFNSYTKGQPSDPAVLLLHGLLGSARNLYRLAEAIANAGFFVVAYDQRGHGHSPHLGDYSLGAMAGDVFTVMDSFGLKRAHLVGHSMGARVSLAAAALRPERVKSLTMLDSGIGIRPEHLRSLHEIIDPLADSYPNRAAAEQALAHHPAAFRQFLVSNLRADQQPPHVLRWVFDLAGVRRELLNTIQARQEDAWRAIRCPVLVARGNRSDSMFAEDLDEMARLNPAARTATIADSGHWVHVDNFKATAELVTSFLSSAEENKP